MKKSIKSIMNFSEYLSQKNIDGGLYSVLTDLAFCVKEIADALESGNTGYAGGENVYGEKQIKMDVMANRILVSRLNDNADVSFIASEELEIPYEAEVPGGGYSVCFDPLDGSSVVDANLAVGTIVGVYQGQGVVGRTCSEQVAAVVAVYGPRLSLLVAVGEWGVDEFIFNRSQNSFVLSGEGLRVSDDGKIFSPGNLGFSGVNLKQVNSAGGGYAGLLDYWIGNGYKLRYSGCMAVDINQIIKRGGGVFLYPASGDAPAGKLRLLYECAPFAMILERAGGVAVGGSDFSRILDIEIESLEQTVPVILGSQNEVERAVSFLTKNQ